MNIGYARVSTKDQSLDSQIDALNAASCDKIFHDIGTGRKNNTALLEAIDYARKGDCLIVTRLDRLGRTLGALVPLVNDLSNRGVHFQSLTQKIDTETAHGRFFFHVMAAFGEMERELISERTKAGVNAAKKRGKSVGRKPALTADQITEAKTMLHAKKSREHVARIFHCSVSTLYAAIPARSLKEHT